MKNAPRSAKREKTKHWYYTYYVTAVSIRNQGKQCSETCILSAYVRKKYLVFVIAYAVEGSLLT